MAAQLPAGLKPAKPNTLLSTASYPISGFTFMTDTAVESGDRPGLWVRPESWDPEDPFDDRRFYPPPDEPVPDDEVL